MNHSHIVRHSKLNSTLQAKRRLYHRSNIAKHRATHVLSNKIICHQKKCKRIFERNHFLKHLEKDHAIEDINKKRDIQEQEQYKFKGIFRDIVLQHSVYSIIKVVNDRPFVVPAKNKPKTYSMIIKDGTVKFEASHGGTLIDYGELQSNEFTAEMNEQSNVIDIPNQVESNLDKSNVQIGGAIVKEIIFI